MEGFESLKEVFNDNIGSFLYKYVEPADPVDIQSHQLALAAEEHDLIICIGFFHTSPLDYTAGSYPSQQFSLIDDVLDRPNVASIIFKEHEGSFLVGAMAAMTTQTNKVGFLGGMDIFLINKFLAGYQQGVNYFDEDIQTTVAYSPDPANVWGDISGGKIIGNDLFDQDHDVIYTAAGMTGMGVMEAASERSGVFGIGVDSDWDGYFPGKILCSMIKKTGTAVYKTIEDLFHGSWSAGLSELGIVEDGVDISPMIYNTDIRDGLYTKDSVTQTRWEFIQDIKQMISSGTLLVIDTPNWSSLTFYEPTASTTTTVTSDDTKTTLTITTTSTSKTTTEEVTTTIPTEITSWPGLMPILLLLSLILMRKRRGK